MNPHNPPRLRFRALTTVLLLLAAARPAAAGPSKVPILLDTDIGGDIDDALALGLVLSSPEIDLRGITTVHGDAHTRALILCRLLHAIGRTDVPVASGKPVRGRPDYTGQLQYGLRPAFRKRPVKESAVEFLYGKLKADPGKLTLLAIGPLTNVAELLEKHPDCKPWIKRIVLMGGALNVGYKGIPPMEAEWNVKSDIAAAKAVFNSGVPLVVVPLDATATLKLEAAPRDAILRGGTPLSNQLAALHQLWSKETPTLFDPVAAALCIDERWCKLEAMRLEVDDKGMTRPAKGKPNARVAMSIKRDAFLKWFTQRLAPEKPKPFVPLKATNPSKPVERGNLPNRVHVIENYETFIERRWWLCGKRELEDDTDGRNRVCRGVLTNDFDDRMGDPKAMYTAVIFNPVPGPPMGENTRLTFRCYLKGTDKLRVQIYSLSNGYHRHLTLTDLPREKWQRLTVDMTQARRPDGSGGPLSENERIDDIQFYTDRGAELLIDDIVLYDAAPADEKRPFPSRPIFCGWFDTGKQGKEWPGDFAIVPHKPPLTWKAAKSVANKETGRPWLRVYLRGGRPLNEKTKLRFRYHLTGTDTMEVRLYDGKRKTSQTITAKELKQGAWSEVTLEFAGAGKANGRADAIHFPLPKGATLLLDDVLLY